MHTFFLAHVTSASLKYSSDHIVFYRDLFVQSLNIPFTGSQKETTPLDIPCDYYGFMGVPVTFMQYYNPNQFEILGDSRYHDGQDYSDDINVINGKTLYRRLLIRRKQEESGVN